MQQQFNNVGAESFNFDTIVKGALDGFGNGSMKDIFGTIEKITGGQGELLNRIYFLMFSF